MVSQNNVLSQHQNTQFTLDDICAQITEKYLKFMINLRIVEITISIKNALKKQLKVKRLK